MRKKSKSFRHDPSVAKEIIGQLGLAFEEIAQHCGCRPQTIKEWMDKGIPDFQLLKLRKLLESRNSKSPIVTLNVSINLSNPDMYAMRKIRDFLDFIENNLR